MSLFGSTYQLDGPSDPIRFAPSSRRFSHNHKTRKPRKPRHSRRTNPSSNVPLYVAGSSKTSRLPRPVKKTKATPKPPSASNSRHPSLQSPRISPRNTTRLPSFSTFLKGAAPAPPPFPVPRRTGPTSRFVSRRPASNLYENSSSNKGPSRFWEKNGGVPLWDEAKGAAAKNPSKSPVSPPGKKAGDKLRGATHRLDNTLGDVSTCLANSRKDANEDGDGEGGSGGRRRPAYPDEPMDYDELFGPEDEEHEQQQRHADVGRILQLDRLPNELKTAILQRAVGLCTLRRNTAATIRALPADPAERHARVASLAVVGNDTPPTAQGRWQIPDADRRKYARFRARLDAACGRSRALRAQRPLIEDWWLTNFPMDVVELERFVRGPDPALDAIAFAFAPRDWVCHRKQHELPQLRARLGLAAPDDDDDDRHRRYGEVVKGLLGALPPSLRRVDFVATSCPCVGWLGRYVRSKDCRDGYDPQNLHAVGIVKWLREKRPDLRIEITRVPGPAEGFDPHDFDTWAWL